MEQMSGSGGPFFRDHIAGIDGKVHLYTGAEGPSIHAHTSAAMRYFEDKSRGEEGRLHLERELEMTRGLIAERLQGEADRVAFFGNTSDALHRLIGSIELHDGDNVVTTELEFPSGVISLLALRRLGVEVRVVPARDWMVSHEDLRAHVDSRTRLIVASHVSYLTGARMDTAEVREIADAAGAVFVLDATQSLGVVPVTASDADAIVASSYKWLLGSHGVGIAYLNHPDRFAERLDGVGWRSVPDPFTPDRFTTFSLRPGARRFELGSPDYLAIYLLNESLRMLGAVEASAMYAYVATLCGEMIDRLRAADLRVLTPQDPARRGASVSVSVRDGEEVARELHSMNVLVWGGDGRVRLSVHGFATLGEVMEGAESLQRVIESAE